jgi:hypothetical protein
MALLFSSAARLSGLFGFFKRIEIFAPQLKFHGERSPLFRLIRLIRLIRNSDALPGKTKTPALKNRSFLMLG